jgi:glycine/D-amino acid oxidase-like deaminating enzyme
MSAPGMYRSISLWHDTLPEGATVPRPGLDGTVRADVAILGAGYTGLWSAYYLKKLDPTRDVVVIEADIAGFGASGRNGGWASGEFSLQRERAAARLGKDAVARLFREVHGSIDEIGRVVAEEDIDADFAKGGSLTLATSAAQAARLAEWVEDERTYGFDEGDFRWLGSDEVTERVRSDKAVGAVFTPHCAAVHPAKLATGLARVVEGMGVRILEQTRATAIEPGRVVTTRGDVKAPVVLRCTEAFTTGLPGGRRELAPIYSLMIATEPLPDAVWDEIGLADRETFNDARHLVIYGQRTADGRFAFGGRGAPYHFGSAMRPDFEQNPETHRKVAEVLRWLFPQMGDPRITHTWGGAVAVPRDWTASVAFDPVTGMGSAGGYVGAGVTATNLAGRTLADLVTGRDTDLVHLPWVGHVSRRWEPEPLRWVGINLGRSLAPWADAREFRTGKPARALGGLLHFLTGH